MWSALSSLWSSIGQALSGLALSIVMLVTPASPTELQAPELAPPPIRTTEQATSSVSSELSAATTTDTLVRPTGNMSASSKPTGAKIGNAPPSSPLPSPIATPQEPPPAGIPVPPPPQQTVMSAAAQKAIDHYNTTGSCSGLATELLSACTTYALNHVSDYELNRQADAKLAADAAAEAKSKRLAEQAAVEAAAAANPMTCSVQTPSPTTRIVRCNNIKAATYVIERFALLYTADGAYRASSAQVGQSIKLEVAVTDLSGTVYYNGLLDDAKSKTVATRIEIPGNIDAAASNSQLAFHIEIQSCTGDCVATRGNWSFSIDDIDGRFADGTQFSPKIAFE